MFVLSMKTTRPRMAVYGVVLSLLVVVMFTAARRDAARVQSVVAGGDDASRVAYLQSLGYEVEPQWDQVREVTVPTRFDADLTAYNELQKAAGNDLTRYKGQRVKCYTYVVKNHPHGEGVVAHLYEYDGTIIGGDVRGDGLLQGLTPPPRE